MRKDSEGRTFVQDRAERTMTRSRVSSIAKITRPGFSRVCLRKRLFARIGKGRGGRAVWVSGPPGAGKTILVSS